MRLRILLENLKTIKNFKRFQTIIQNQGIIDVVVVVVIR